MGLDMYLERRHYIGATYEHREVTGAVDIRVRGIRVPIRLEKLSTISEQVGYWRKANAVHNWFVQNIQNGNDDCGEYECCTEHLEDLKAECQKALDGDPDTMQPVSGFFFGSTDKDEYWREDLQDTINIINQVVEEHSSFPDEVKPYYVYRASW